MAAASDHKADLRPEIQALRAIAVMVVVVCHFWEDALPGGYIGVDVFFAISGFLITSHLLREVDRTGSVSLAAFWARRARRILPAALLTLALAGIATVLLVELDRWGQWFAEIRAGAFYVENWHLAGAAADYFAADDAPSPVRHYWSLSAEEQFYLVWPVLIVAASWLALKVRGRRSARPTIAAVLGVVTLASLVFSVLYTASNPASAYFITPTRAWEFGLGGLLALVPVAVLRPAVASAVSWLGIALIAVTSAAYSAATEIPGWKALIPVLGGLAVIWAGAPRGRLAPTPLMALRPVQVLGDVSYSIYLWHWPLLVLAPFALDRGLTTADKLVLVGLTILLAWVTKTVVEDPVRTRSFFTRRQPRWTFAGVAAATGAVLAISGTALSHERSEVRKAEARTKATVAAKPRCFGAADRDPRKPCDNPDLRKLVVPTPAEATEQSNGPCEVEPEEVGGQKVCAFGAPRAGSSRTVAIIGDSHTTHWRAGLDVVAKARGWHALQLGHLGCPLSAATRKLEEPGATTCRVWKRGVVRWLGRHPEVKTVFVSSLSGGLGVFPTEGRSAFETAVDGYVDMWASFPDSVEEVVVIRDNPRQLTETPTCITKAISRGADADAACALPRKDMLDRDAAYVAAGRAEEPTVHRVDLTPFFCDRRTCHVVVGGVLVHQDESHMTATFNETLGPYLLRAVDRLMPRSSR